MEDFLLTNCEMIKIVSKMTRKESSRALTKVFNRPLSSAETGIAVEIENNRIGKQITKQKPKVDNAHTENTGNYKLVVNHEHKVCIE